MNIKISIPIDLEFEEQTIANNEKIWTNDEYGIEITQRNHDPISNDDIEIINADDNDNDESVCVCISKKDIAKAFNNLSFIICLLFLFNSISAFAQTDLKQYSSKFGEGQATYTFYENEDGVRIFHGDFIYQYKGTDGGTCNIKGKYVNGNRDGIWTFDFKRNQGQIGGSYKTGGYYDNIVDEENYQIEVLPNGDKKRIYNVKRVLIPEKTEYYQKVISKVDLTITGAYNNGLENGSWIYKNNGKIDTVLVKSGVIIDNRKALVKQLTTDEKNLLHGTIKTFYNGFMYSSEFYHGYLIQTKKVNPNSDDGSDMEMIKPTFSFSDNQSHIYKYVNPDSCSNDVKLLKKYIDGCYTNYDFSKTNFYSKGSSIILNHPSQNSYTFLFTTDIRYFESLYEYPFANEDIKKMKGITKPSDEITDKIINELEGKKVYILGKYNFTDLSEDKIIQFLAKGGMGCSPSYCSIEYSILNKSTFYTVNSRDIILGFHCFKDNDALRIYIRDNNTINEYFTK